MRERYSLGKYQDAVDRAVADAAKKSYALRIWSKDATLWKADPEHRKIIQNALGWLTVPGDMLPHVSDLQAFTREARQRRLSTACLLGMGGSSLCPEVCALTFGSRPGYLNLVVLDTTDSRSIISAENTLDLERTLFIVSSKSGGTIESACLQKYFFERLTRVKNGPAGENFVAITDPGTPLEKLATDLDFWRIFRNPSDIGGRYSALSFFGLVPMALLGLDLSGILARALEMAALCQPSVPAAENPGIVLGCVLGTLAREGRDKVTFVLEPEILAFGYWLEQLVAESTGKEGLGILPVEGEPLIDPSRYGEDRLIVNLGLAGYSSPLLNHAIQALEAAGHPVARWELRDPIDLGSEFFLWEYATAVAGAIMGINPFDQPNVQESKDNTQKLIREFQTTSRLPEGSPLLVDENISLHCDASLAQRLLIHHKPAHEQGSLGHALKSFLQLVRPGDYAAPLAYVERSTANQEALTGLRRRICESLGIATTMGFGPRYLHSTGQLHKGGPNNGLFFQITADDLEDPEIPGETYSFSTLKRAQALGDLQALEKHGRRVVRLHIDGELQTGLEQLGRIFHRILS